MTQMVLNIEDVSIVPSLRKVINLMQGVTIVKPKRRRKTEMELALEDKNAGRIIKCKDKEDLFKKLGI